MSKGLSIRAYAQHRKEQGLSGCSPWSVKKALRDGRITRNDHGKIEPEIADREWEQNTNPAQRPDPGPLSDNERERGQRDQELNPPGIPSYSQSRAVKEAYQARIARLQYEEMTGQVVRSSSVKAEAFRRARMVRDQILAVPDRLAPVLAAEGRAREVHRLLMDELRKALEAQANV